MWVFFSKHNVYVINILKRRKSSQRLNGWLLQRANIKSSNLAGLMYFPVTIRHGNDFSGGKQPLKPVHCIFLAAPYRADGGGCGVHRLSGYIERAILEVRSGGQRSLSTLIVQWPLKVKGEVVS